MIRRILVPLDGSSQAEAVLPYVVALASVFGARLDLLHVITGGKSLDRGGLSDPLAFRLTESDRKAYLDARASELRRQGVQVRTLVQEGEAAEAMVGLLRSGNYDLIGLTSHGEGCENHLGMGSTAMGAVLNAKTSILIVPSVPSEDQLEVMKERGSLFGSIVVPVDLSPRSDWSVNLAAAIARGTGSKLSLVHVLSRPEMVSRLPESSGAAFSARQVLELNRREARRHLEQSVLRVRGKDLEVRQQLIEASDGTAEALRELLASEEPGLVILSAHGQGGSTEWPLGGTAAKLILRAEWPTLILQDLPAVRPQLKRAPRSSRAATHRV